MRPQILRKSRILSEGVEKVSKSGVEGIPVFDLKNGVISPKREKTTWKSPRKSYVTAGDLDFCEWIWIRINI